MANARRLYCVLDDLNKCFTKVQWSISKERLITGGAVSVPISTRDKTERTGLLNIGDRRNWLFTKKLFVSESLESQIGRLIARTMLPLSSSKLGD